MAHAISLQIAFSFAGKMLLPYCKCPVVHLLEGLVLVAAGRPVAAPALLADKAGCSRQRADRWLCGRRTARRAPRTSESCSVPNLITSPSEGSTTPGRRTVEVSAGAGLSIPWLRQNWNRAAQGFALPRSLQGQVSWSQWSGGQVPQAAGSVSLGYAASPSRGCRSTCIPPGSCPWRWPTTILPRPGSLTPVQLLLNFVALLETVPAASELFNFFPRVCFLNC